MWAPDPPPSSFGQRYLKKSKIRDLRSEDFLVSYQPTTGRRRLCDSFLVSAQTGRRHRGIWSSERPRSSEAGQGRGGTGTQGRGAGARVFPTSQR